MSSERDTPEDALQVFERLARNVTTDGSLPTIYGNAIKILRTALAAREGGSETWDELEKRQYRERIAWQRDHDIVTREDQERWQEQRRTDALARLRTGTETQGES